MYCTISAEYNGTLTYIVAYLQNIVQRILLYAYFSEEHLHPYRHFCKLQPLQLLVALQTPAYHDVCSI